MTTSTRVDFYILDQPGQASRLQFACRLSEKAFVLDNHVFAHTADARLARELDQLLWTFRQNSFVPHEVLDDDPPNAPVRIGTDTRVEERGDLLINLSDSVPPFVTGFARIAEIVDGDETARSRGRERFQQYRDMGITPETHRIGANA